MHHDLNMQDGYNKGKCVTGIDAKLSVGARGIDKSAGTIWVYQQNGPCESFLQTLWKYVFCKQSVNNHRSIEAEGSVQEASSHQKLRRESIEISSSAINAKNWRQQEHKRKRKPREYDDDYEDEDRDDFPAPKKTRMLIVKSLRCAGSKHGSSPILKKIMSSPKTHRTVGDKNDYNWLLTPSGAPFISPLDMEPKKASETQDGTPITCPADLNSRSLYLVAVHYMIVDQISRKKINPNSNSPPPGSNSSSSESCRPSSSGSQVSATSKPETPTEHHNVSISAKPSRLLKPSLRATLPSTKSMVPSTRSSARTSTPTARPTVPACKSKTRSGTPTRGPSTPLAVSSVSVPPGRSSSVGKLGPKTTSIVATSRANPIVRSRQQNPSGKPGFSTNAPQNSSGLTTKRSVSNSRCGHGTIDSKERLRQCSPLRGSDPNGSASRSGSSFPAVSRAYSNDGDNVSPLLYGTKMIERVVNMRKLAPPKQESRSS
ncbi:hypothetical protein AQUCO_02100137v1, partial [Aquilegia coerulea]